MKSDVRQILLQTSLEVVQMYHLGDIFHIHNRHCPSVLLETAVLSAKARKVRPQTVIQLPATHQESTTSRLVSEWNCTTGGKCMTGLSQRRNVIPKFSPAWDPPHSLLCKVSTPWTLRAPLTSALPVTHWFSPDRLSKFNSPFPLPHPPPQRFREKTSFLQFYKQKSHVWYN